MRRRSRIDPDRTYVLEQYSFLLDPEHVEQMKAIRDASRYVHPLHGSRTRQDRSVSAQIRQAIREYLERTAAADRRQAGGRKTALVDAPASRPDSNFPDPGERPGAAINTREYLERQ